MKIEELSWHNPKITSRNIIEQLQLNISSKTSKKVNYKIRRKKFKELYS